MPHPPYSLLFSLFFLFHFLYPSLFLIIVLFLSLSSSISLILSPSFPQHISLSVLSSVFLHVCLILIFSLPPGSCFTFVLSLRFHFFLSLLSFSLSAPVSFHLSFFQSIPFYISFSQGFIFSLSVPMNPFCASVFVFLYPSHSLSPSFRHVISCFSLFLILISLSPPGPTFTLLPFVFLSPTFHVSLSLINDQQIDVLHYSCSVLRSHA